MLLQKRSTRRRIARFPVRGSGVATPTREKAELARVLSDLRLPQPIDDHVVDEIYSQLAVITGKWFAEQERVEVEPVASALLRMAKNLSEVSQLMSGLETGMRTSFEIAVASQLSKYLAFEPTIGSNADQLMTSFREQAAQIAHVCMVGYVELSQEAGKRGRLALDWYDDFTALLLDTSAKAGIEPTLRKDRLTGVRSGWLFEAAQSLETFLQPHMRSPSQEACGKRLERSRRRLRAPARQKPSAS
jgi:hypothetical protein